MTLNATFALIMKANGIPLFKTEWPFDPIRRWRFDFAWPQATPPVAVEIEGGIFIRGSGHVGAMHYSKNCEKYNQAALDGWVLLRFTNKMLEENSGYVIDIIKRALKCS